MKKILLSLLVMFSIGCGLQAQFPKGSVLLGGRISFGADKTVAGNSTDFGKSHQYNFSPAVGKAVKENIFFGVELSIAGAKSKSNMAEQTNTHLGGGVFLRRYLSLGKSFYFFGEGRTGFTTFREKRNPVVQYPSAKGYSIYLGMYPGVAFAVSRRFQIEAGFNDLLFANFTRSRFPVSVYQETIRKTFAVGTNLSNGSFSVGARILLLK